MVTTILYSGILTPALLLEPLHLDLNSRENCYPVSEQLRQGRRPLIHLKMDV